MAEEMDWRGRYRTLVFETEQQEKRLARVLGYLRELTAQLDIALAGQMPRCEQLLRLLRRQLQSGKLESVPELLREISGLVRQLDVVRAQRAEQLLSRIADWAQLLQQRLGEEQGALDSVRRKLDSAESMQQLPELIDTLLRYQRQLERVADTDDLAQQDVFSARLAKRLLALIQLLNVPAPHRVRTHELIRQLESGPTAAELEACLEEISWLTQVCHGVVEKDIQQYLAGLNEQLEYLRGFMERTAAADVGLHQRNQVLDRTIRADVQDLGQALEQSQTLEQLKQTVSQRMSSLIRAVDSHKAEQGRHIALLQQERELLLERLSDMESKTDMFRRSAAEAHLKSQRDPLTGLANRYAYDLQLNNELERFQRYATPFSVCIVDIDFFKRVNDDYGHLAGDKLLRLLASILRESLRKVDFLARIGGEEFVILMPSTTKEEAQQAAEKVRVAVEQGPFHFQEKRVPITVSIGIGEIAAGDSAELLFERADRHLYEAKSRGRNRVVVG